MHSDNYIYSICRLIFLKSIKTVSPMDLLLSKQWLGLIILNQLGLGLIWGRTNCRYGVCGSFVYPVICVSVSFLFENGPVQCPHLLSLQPLVYLHIVFPVFGPSVQLLVQALVLSRLDYCNALLAGLPACTIKPLQLIQNAAARVVFNEPKKAHVTPLFIRLHWLPIAAHINSRY